MTWLWSVSHPLLISASLASLGMAFFVWRNRAAPARPWLVAMLLTGVAWALSMTLEVGLPYLPLAEWLTGVQLIAIAGIPFFYLGFVGQFAGIPAPRRQRHLLLAALVPALIAGLTLTNRLHGLIWRDAQLITHGFMPGMSLTMGPAIYLFLLYMCIVLLGGTWSLIRRIKERDRIYRSQVMTITAGLCVTAIISLIDFIPIFEPNHFLTTAISYNLIAMIVAGRLAVFLNADQWAASREQTFNSLDDPLLVLDASFNILDLNPAARKICDPGVGEPLGQPIQAACPALASYIKTGVEPATAVELRLPVNGSPRTFEIRLTPMRQAPGREGSLIVLLHNVSRLKAVEGSIRRRTVEMEALLNSAQLISSSMQLEEMVTRLAEHWTSTLQVSGTTISWWNAQDGQLTTWMEWPPGGSALPGLTDRVRDPDAHPLIQRVLRERSPQQIHREGPLDDQAEFANLGREGTASLLLLPLVAGEEVIGLVELSDTRAHPFSPGEVRLCMALAEQLAVAVQNTRRNHAIREQLRDQTLLRQASQVLTATLDQAEVLNVLAEQFVQAGSGTSGYICSYDFTRHTATVIAEYISPQANLAERESDLGATYAFEKNSGFLSNHQPLSYHPDDPEVSPQELAHLAKYAVKTVLVIPIRLKDEVIAFAEIWETRVRREFTPGEINLCQDLAQHAALALHNASLYHQAQQEIAERRRVEDILRHKALHDALTGLPNRVLFAELLEQSIARLKRHPDNAFAVLYLDLDHFKDVNDSLGHSVGDAFLGQVSLRLCQQVREVDTVARIGGDEFAVLLDHIEEPHQAVYIADRIQDSLSQPLMVGRHALRTSASIGIVISSSHYTQPDDYLRDADIAMYQAKEGGKARYAIFDRSMHAEIVDRLKIESELRRALEQGELVLHYQPLVRLNDNQVIGFEALTRWQHPTMGLLLPATFLPLAERNDLVAAIDRWAMQTACRQVHTWQAEFPGDEYWTINLNLSARNFSDPHWFASVVEILQACNLAPGQVQLEIVEGVLSGTGPAITAALERLKQLGAGIQLDNYGSGASSLHHLSNFPIDSIKIDRSCIGAITTDPAAADLVRSVLLLAHELGKQVTAEGVETALQASFLAAHGCQLAQGYIYAPPLSAAEITALLAELQANGYRLAALSGEGAPSPPPSPKRQRAA